MPEIPPLPWWAKIITGIVGFTTVYMLFDLINLFEIFFLVIAPVIVALVSLKLIGEGTANFLAGGALNDLRDRITTARDQVQAADPAYAAPV